VRSFNGKMSEYTAAVGLAGLDAWNRTRSDFLRVARRYRDLFAGRQDVALQEGFGREWISSTAMICFRNRGAREVAQKLFQERIGTRRWWGGGLHRHAAFAECPRRHLPNSEELAECVLGLPCWSDLPNEQIERIGQLVLSATE
jgi:dTDP-4-amino-4,6-dideoxygalactose transaminase